MWKRLDAKEPSSKSTETNKDLQKVSSTSTETHTKHPTEGASVLEPNSDGKVNAVVGKKLGELKSTIKKKPYDRPQTKKSTDTEWDPRHFRLFVGNLGPAVTTEVLAEAFAKFPSLSKSRVVFDKRTQKSKGYGFVAFADSKDYLAAFQTMQNKYIGSQPVMLKRARPMDK